MTQPTSIKYLTQEQAIQLDKDLVGLCAFDIRQLMELAGLSVAVAIAKTYPLPQFKNVLVYCGSGNNGGDGLVAARHLKIFGYAPVVVYPRQANGQMFSDLVIQCEKTEVEVHRTVAEESARSNCNLVVDAIFGFSFRPPNKYLEYAKLIRMMNNYSKICPLVSIDIPSGWNVDTGYANIDADQIETKTELKIPTLQPECLISLTAPKKCASEFKGKYHYLGGRFCPEQVQLKYKLNLPPYPGTECVQLL